MAGMFAISGQDFGPLLILLFALGPLLLRILRGKKTVANRVPTRRPSPASPPTTVASPEFQQIPATTVPKMQPIFGSPASTSGTLPAHMTGPGEIKPTSTFPRFFVLVALVLLAWLIWHSVSRKEPAQSGPQGRPTSHSTTDKQTSPSRLI